MLATLHLAASCKISQLHFLKPNFLNLIRYTIFLPNTASATFAKATLAGNTVSKAKFAEAKPSQARLFAG